MSTLIANGFAAAKAFKKPGKHMFWAWILYQTIKGILPTSLIWIPLVWALLG